LFGLRSFLSDWICRILDRRLSLNFEGRGCLPA
jgi:hypothetical protein